nr:hypothetical protein CFP56_72955 [Quercus suber]
MELEKNSTWSCNFRGANVEGPSGIVPDSVQGNVEDNVHDSTYGSWIVVKHKGVEGFKELKGLTFSSLCPKLTENGKKVIKMEKAKLAIKPNPQASVKGKKALARSRATTNVIDRRGSSSNL